jgi:hypothetical protein
LSKLVLSQENMVWLINLHNQERFIDVLSVENSRCSVDTVKFSSRNYAAHRLGFAQP